MLSLLDHLVLSARARLGALARTCSFNGCLSHAKEAIPSAKRLARPPRRAADHGALAGRTPAWPGQALFRRGAPKGARRAPVEGQGTPRISAEPSGMAGCMLAAR